MSVEENALFFQTDYGAVLLSKSGRITFIQPNFGPDPDRAVVWLFRETALALYGDAFKHAQGYYDETLDIHLVRISSPPSERIRVANVAHGSNGHVSVKSGVHRTTALLRGGAEIIPFDMDRDSLNNLRAHGHEVVGASSADNFTPKLKVAADFIQGQFDPVVSVRNRSRIQSELPLAEIVETAELSLKLLAFEVQSRQWRAARLHDEYTKYMQIVYAQEALWRFDFIRAVLPAWRYMREQGVENWPEGAGYPYGKVHQASPEDAASKWLNSLKLPDLPAAPVRRRALPGRDI